MPVEYMLITALLGIASSLVTELIAWVNKKLSGTALQGDGALILSILLAFGGGFARLLMTGVPLNDIWDWSTFVSVSATVFGWSQVYFQTISRWLNLRVDHFPQY